MTDIKQIIDSNKIPQYKEKIDRYVETHEKLFKMFEIDFKQFFFDDYLKHQGYKFDDTVITIDYRTTRLLWFHYCETFDVYNDESRSYRLTLKLLDTLIKMFINSSSSWRKEYCIRIENIYKSPDIFPTDIDYKLTIHYINNKLGRYILPLVFQVKELNSNNNDRPKRKYDNYDKYNDYDNDYKNLNKRERKERTNNLKSPIIDVKVNNSWVGPDSDYFTFLSSDLNPELAHKQYLNCIESAYYYFKTMKYNPGQMYFEKLLKTDNPDSFHEENVGKLKSIYNFLMRTNSNSNSSSNSDSNSCLRLIPNNIQTNIPSPVKPPIQSPVYSYGYGYSQNPSQNPSPTNSGHFLTSSPVNFYQHHHNPTIYSGPNYGVNPNPYINSRPNGYINNQPNYTQPQPQPQPNIIQTKSEATKQWEEYFEYQDRNLRNTSLNPISNSKSNSNSNSNSNSTSKSNFE